MEKLFAATPCKKNKRTLELEVELEIGHINLNSELFKAVPDYNKPGLKFPSWVPEHLKNEVIEIFFIGNQEFSESKYPEFTQKKLNPEKKTEQNNDVETTHNSEYEENSDSFNLRQEEQGRGILDVESIGRSTFSSDGSFLGEDQEDQKKRKIISFYNYFSSSEKNAEDYNFSVYSLELEINKNDIDRAQA